MVRLSLQVKAGPASTKSCFSCCCYVLCVLHAFGHHKANLIKYDLGRLERLFSGQFEELKRIKMLMFPETTYFKQFLRKHIIKIKYFFSMCPQNWKKGEDYM